MTAPFKLVAERLWTVPANLTGEPFRYEFGWTWATGPIGLFIGINPSFGTADKPDRTMGKWRGIASRNGWGGYLAGNPFARRALEPKELLGSMNLDVYAVGRLNESILVSMVERADLIVPCWGVVPRELYRHVSRLEIALERCGKPMFCLGRTKEGFPRHPLYLSSGTALEKY